jgi:hypothetical protein
MSYAEGAVHLPKGFPRPLFQRECPNGVGRRIIGSGGHKLDRLISVVVEET